MSNEKIKIALQPLFDSGIKASEIIAFIKERSVDSIREQSWHLIEHDDNQLKQKMVEDIIDHLTPNDDLTLWLDTDDGQGISISYSSWCMDGDDKIIGEIVIKHITDYDQDILVNNYEHTFDEDDRSKGILQAIDHFINCSRILNAE